MPKSALARPIAAQFATIDLGPLHGALGPLARLARAQFAKGEAQLVLANSAASWASNAGGAFIQEERAASYVGELDWDAKAGCVRAPIWLADGGCVGHVRLSGLAGKAYSQALASQITDLAQIAGHEADRALGFATPSQQAATTRAFTIAFVRNAPVPLAMTDRELALIETSPRWRGEVGGEAADGSIYDVLPQAREHCAQAWARCLAGDRLATDRREFKLPDGRNRWLQLETTTWRDANGAIGGLLVLAQDVTELVDALQQTKHAEYRLNLAAEIAEIHVWEFDFVGERLLKVGAEDTFFERPVTYEDMKADMFGVIHPDDQPTARALSKQAIKDNLPFQMEYRVNRTDGVEVWAAAGSKVIWGDDGRPVSMIGAMQNITARKAGELAMEVAKAESEAANTAKSEFLANMSHEIRTPMNGIIGMNALLMRSELTADQKKFAEAVRVSADCLLGIINDILDISKLEAGKVELEAIDFSLETVVEDVVELMSPRASEKSLEVACYLDDGARDPLRGDPTRIRQVLLNLLSNAIKFTEEGHVSVEVRSHPVKNGVGLRLEVCDTGIGLTADARSKLFQKFQQADGSITRRFGGTGLGLSICRQLVELMGGEIGVEDGRDGGTIFFVEIELPRAQAAIQPRRRTANGLKGVRILVVDDIEINRSIFTRQLAADGAICEETESGRIAVEMVLAADAAGKPYDILLLDHMMPDMAGDMVAETVRASPLKNQPKMLLASSVGIPMSDERAGKAGFDAYMTKPVRHQALVDCLIDLVARARETHSIAAAPLVASPGGSVQSRAQGRILLAEDNEINTLLACTILEEAGYSVECVVNGALAVEAARAGGFDLVLMDVQMPEMDGLQATRMIRGLGGVASQTPIVAMTANAMRSDQDNCMAAGMDDFISKPIDPDAFLAVIQRFMSQTSQTTPAETAVIAPAEIPDLDDSHLDGLARLLPPDRFRTIVESYLAAARERLTRIEARARDLDFVNIARDAHDLKGTSGNFGARKLQALAEQLEAVCKDEDAVGMAALIMDIGAASQRAWALVEQRFSVGS